MPGLQQFILRPLFNDSRRTFWHIILGVWGAVAVYAVLHDLHIVRIFPEHFTVYHANPLNIGNPYVLSGLWAFGASFAPGCLLGIALYFASRAGSCPQISPSFVIRGAIAAVVITEVLSLLSGLAVAAYGRPLYPEILYPEKSLPAMVAQTMQLSAYLFGAFSGAMLICIVLYKRKKLA
jgi:hypothetical protein